MNEKTSVEQAVRDLLTLAIREGLVSESLDYAEPDPQCRSSGELVALANLIQERFGGTGTT